MILPKLFSSQTSGPQQTTQLFFAIEITEQDVQSALWQVDGATTLISAHSDRHKWKDDESCIAAIDKSLQELGKESENVKQTLFALNSDWINPDGIIPKKKPLFQKMTKELELEPIGFVVVTEALVQYLNEKTPQLSILLIEVETHQLTVSFVRGGAVLHTVKVGRSGESVSDLNEALAHFKEKVFPSKMMLFSSVLSVEEITDVQQQLISNDWLATYPFLHPPIIETLEEKSLLEIVIKTGGRAVAQSKGLLKEMDVAPVVAAAMPVVAEAAAEPMVMPEPMPEKEEAPVSTSPPTPPVSMPIPEKEIANVETVPNQEIAFTETEKPKPVLPQQLLLPLHNRPNHQPNYQPHHSSPITPTHSPKSQKSFWAAHAPFMFLGILGGILVLVGLTFFVAQKTMKALVTVTLNTQPLSKDVLLTLNPQLQQSDPNNLALKATVVNQPEVGDKTVQTTGTKKIGDKATGTVTIFNFSDGAKTFTAGTKLSDGTHTFTLDQATTVASGSTTIDSNTFQKTTTPGSTDAAITAAAIGEDSNIGVATELTIDTFAKTTFMARTKAALSGGTTREIQAVSQQDEDMLLSSLKADLLSKAAQDFAATAGSTQHAVPTNRIKVLKSQFSSKVGDETNSFSLHLEIQAEALSYDNNDLKPLAMQLLSKDVQPGYTLASTDPSILSQPATTATNSAQVTLQTSLTSVAKPNVNTDQWKQEIAGKTVTLANNFLHSQSAIKIYQIQIEPSILALVFHSLPKQTDRITFQMNE